MVALKPLGYKDEDIPLIMKQERRGGIETKLDPELRLPPAQKQERRGGIETETDPL